MNRQNLNYEELYDRLYERGETLHRSNQKRIRIGLIFLAVFTVAMILIRWITGSDRVVFLVIWVIGMFAISIYLISIEYIDSSVQKTLEDVTERETGFDDLLPDSENVRELLQARLAERREEAESRFIDHWRRGSNDAADAYEALAEAAGQAAESEDAE